LGEALRGWRDGGDPSSSWYSDSSSCRRWNYPSSSITLFAECRMNINVDFNGDTTALRTELVTVSNAELSPTTHLLGLGEQ